MEIDTCETGYMLSGLALTYLSRKPLSKISSHGFYRYFAWIGMLTLHYIKTKPEAIATLNVGWQIPTVLLVSSLTLVILGLKELIFNGNPSSQHPDKKLFVFEKTTSLVSTGVFKHIRHPMYSSLLLLTWGLFFQKPTDIGFFLGLFVSTMLFLTAKADEKECITFFGKKYIDYMKKTKMFLPKII